MTSGNPLEPKRSVYDTCDPQYLRSLREAAGMDVFVLARTACLSVAQVRQLESDDSDHLFYSEAIKRQAYKRLLMILGAEPPTVEIPEELRDAAKVADAHLTTLDQIVAMSEQPSMNHSAFDAVHAGFAKLKEHKQAMGALLLLMVAVDFVCFTLGHRASWKLPLRQLHPRPLCLLLQYRWRILRWSRQSLLRLRSPHLFLRLWWLPLQTCRAKQLGHVLIPVRPCHS